jgi:sarcosine oxidase subunit gamma
MAEDLAPGAVALSEVTGWSLTQIDGWPGSSVEDVLAGLCGFPMPRMVGETTQRGGLRAIRIAPARLWLVNDAPSGIGGLTGAADAAVVSLSHGRRRFRLSGRTARDVLARCVALDWDAPALVPARAAQTSLHRVPILLVRDTPDAFELFVPRSFAQAMRERLEEAARGVD